MSEISRCVLPTKDRSMVVRDYVVQLSKKDNDYKRLKSDKWVILDKCYPAFRREYENNKRMPDKEYRNKVRVKARLVWLDCDPDLDPLVLGKNASIRMDETLRVALGILRSDEIESAKQDTKRIKAQAGKGEAGDGLSIDINDDKNSVNVIRFSGKRSFREFMHDKASSLIRVQPKYLRVQRSHCKDMEMQICRIDESIFDSLGIAIGDFVEISSVAKRNTVECHTRTRALPLNSNHIETRLKEQNKPGAHEKYPLIDRILGLCHLSSDDPDLPWIFLDLDERRNLGVFPGDVVRVCRSANRLLWKRAYVLATPLMLGIVSWAYSFDKFGPYTLAVVLGFSLLALFGVVIMQLQRQIS